jgi:uroporphyrinogen decarboxylase
MTSRQRVMAASRKEPADRVPVFMWFHPSTAETLGRLLEIPARLVPAAMGDDIRQTWVNHNYAMEGIVHGADGEGHLDWWGVRWRRQHGFNQIVHFPLAGAGREEVLAYQFPRDRAPGLLARMDTLAGGEYFLGCDVSPCVFEMYWRLRGMESAMLDMAEDAELADEMFRRCADFSIELGMQACARYALDWFWTGDDVAGQAGMMMHPSTWRSLIRPHLQRVFAVGRAAGLPVAYHCCGALRPIIPDLIEMGLNVLNPLQSNCPGMDPVGLKREFGAHLAFMGGVDTQGLLPNGSAAAVRRETARLIEGMTTDGGGYILAASHSISPETPLENIFAMYEAAGITRQEIFDRAADLR